MGCSTFKISSKATLYLDTIHLGVLCDSVLENPIRGSVLKVANYVNTMEHANRINER